MYTRLAALTAAALLTATAASASTLSSRGTTTETPEQCGQLIAITQQTVTEQQVVGPKTGNQVDELMAKLHEHCAANRFDKADETAAYIRGLVVTE